MSSHLVSYSWCRWLRHGRCFLYPFPRVPHRRISDQGICSCPRVFETEISCSSGQPDNLKTLKEVVVALEAVSKRGIR